MRISQTLSAALLMLLATCSAAREVDHSGQAAGRASAQGHAVVLAYHHVAANTPRSTSIRVEAFDAHLKYLANENVQVWPLSRITRTLTQGETLPPNVVGLSFDDAYESVLETVHPRLQARGWPYTVFVTTQAIDAGRSPYMTWDQLRQLARDGVELGNHSDTHNHLVRRRANESPAAWQARVTADLQQANARIYAETGVTPTLFAYPYGEYTPALTTLVEALNLTGFGQHSGAIGVHSNFTALPRFPMGGAYTDLNRLATSVRTQPLYIDASPPGPLLLHDYDKAPRPNLRISLAPGDYNLDQFACYASGQGRMLVVPLDQAGDYQLQPRRALTPGRTKYNCTVPHSSKPGVFYWWSYLLMTSAADGRWYSD